MLNRPANVYCERDGLGAPAERPWQVDARPAARLVWLFVLLCLPPVCVVARLVQLQQRLSEPIVASSERTHETTEIIPTRNGRILGADGRVLARDAGQFEVLVNYRWLEEPANPAWLRRQTLARLGRAERTDPERVAAAEQAVLAEREALWQRLTELTGSQPDELAARRAEIQQRIERMLASVELRREQTRATARKETISLPGDASLWRRAWHAIVTAVTTSPERDADPLVLPEQSADHLLLDAVPLEAAAEIESHPERYPGLSTRVRSWRDYQAGSLAAHIIGVRRPMTEEGVAGRGRSLTASGPLEYQPGELRGETGVERTYDRTLRGVRGLRRTVRNRRGEIVSSEIVRLPQPGRDVVLTLDVELQQRLEQLLDGLLAERDGEPAGRSSTPSETPESADEALSPDSGRSATPSYEAAAGASIVALDARTGAVLAAVSAPRFDLRIAADPQPREWQALLDDPRRPLFHRALAMTLPPGSTFKVLSAVALLESGLNPDEKLFCQGYLDRPDRNRCYIYRHYGYGHGETDLNDALSRSCNVYFFQAARTIGPEPLVEWAERLGFGQRLGIDLPGEAAGNVPRPPEYDAPLVVAGVDRTSESDTIPPLQNAAGSSGPQPHRWYPGDALGLAIGQSRLTVTPLQMARLMAVVANDGWLVTPHVVRGFGPSLSGEGASGLPGRPAPERLADLNADTLPRIREGLERVVAHPSGTGYKHVRLEEIAIAGKTGTAEVGGGRPDHAWFAGYVPADRPKIAFAVVIEHGGSGGAVAGTVARDMVRAMLELGLVE